jgi:hypothetical protein
MMIEVSRGFLREPLYLFIDHRFGAVVVFTADVARRQARCELPITENAPRFKRREALAALRAAGVKHAGIHCLNDEAVVFYF